jgi:hypothetical protein
MINEHPAGPCIILRELISAFDAPGFYLSIIDDGDDPVVRIRYTRWDEPNTALYGDTPMYEASRGSFMDETGLLDEPAEIAFVSMQGTVFNGVEAPKKVRLCF